MQTDSDNESGDVCGSITSTRGVKRKIRKSSWKKENAKKRRNSGKSYISSSGKTKSAKRKIFGAKRDEVAGEWRKLHNTELHALYSSPDIIRNIKSRRSRWAGHVARMGESRNVYRVLVGRPAGKRPLGRPRRRWEDNIKMDLREVGYDGRDWINLAQDRDQWRAYVTAAMNLRDNREDLELNGLHQLLVYADDVNMVGENPQTIGGNAEILLELELYPAEYASHLFVAFIPGDKRAVSDVVGWQYRLIFRGQQVEWDRRAGERTGQASEPSGECMRPGKESCTEKFPKPCETADRVLSCFPPPGGV
ncbi:hypothetical protein ANN_27410 [Periplaneta americana]|uniref:Uncharacterized protein n=1 Tax=Periplaneta americana TaxID=6978 RepID=A0ABQ8RVR9_PERAM|nr:hypothetical protein ANN_27410 [Periplaneta americana]